VRSYKTFHFF